MGLDVWFRDDVERILDAILEARRTAADGPEHRAGFEDHDAAVRAAFGLRQRRSPPPRTAAYRLLDATELPTGRRAERG